LEQKGNATGELASALTAGVLFKLQVVFYIEQPAFYAAAC
jgi:hypothetical protein